MVESIQRKGMIMYEIKQDKIAWYKPVPVVKSSKSGIKPWFDDEAFHDYIQTRTDFEYEIED